MFEIRDIAISDYDTVLPMVQEFYHSSAVEHDVDSAILERSLRAAADPAPGPAAPGGRRGGGVRLRDPLLLSRGGGTLPHV